MQTTKKLPGARKKLKGALSFCAVDDFYVHGTVLRQIFISAGPLG